MAIPKRYLWAVGVEPLPVSPGELLANRYLLKRQRILLDTYPGVVPEPPAQLNETVEAYLKMAAQPLHVPQVYGVAKLSQRRGSLLLLERAPIYTEGAIAIPTADHPSPPSLEGYLMPSLPESWKTASGVRQLNWLWQLAQLWQPLSLQKAAATLLHPDLIRVEGGLIRLLELQMDDRLNPTLADLGRAWQHWQPAAQPEIADFLEQLCLQMQQGQIGNAEYLVALLDRALRIGCESQSYQVQIATLTDQGPSRQRNEDACYPPNGTVTTIASRATDSHETLLPVMVCDGIGGHEGGDVASNLAIATLGQKLQQFLAVPEIDPVALSLQLEQATLAANDVISRRNDNEQRQERQRMGTTLVMGLAHQHELYLTHVGDSRAYRITRTGCHQMTLDDDMASRETRLGFATYREALLQPGSGSLVQALGMASSSLLHPTVQRWILDEDCLLLLCSDGLSDNDRVEEHWQTELLPVLAGTVDLATAAHRLVTIANSQNGHDNVTVGLMLCQVTPSLSTPEPLPPSLAIPSETSPLADYNYLVSDSASTAIPKTRVIRDRPARGLSSLLLGIAVICGLVYLLAALFVPSLRPGRLFSSPAPSETPTSSPPPSTSPTPAPPPLPSAPPSVGSLIQINPPVRTGVGGRVSVPVLLPQPGRETQTPAEKGIKGEIPAGAVLQVISRQSTPDGHNWLKLKVCSVPGATTPTPFAIQPGEVGWAEEELLSNQISQNLALTASQLNRCATSPTASPKAGL
jgi:serine/threonine protein phosphatase PrpC